MTKLEIRCPSCSGRGFIEVSEEEVKNSSRGLFAVNVAEGIICDHSFVAYVDKNLIIRDTFMADFQIDLPDSIEEQETDTEKSKDLGFIDLSLIKLNITASQLSFLIRAIVLKRYILIISDQEYMFDDMRNFLTYITENSFENSVEIVSELDYKPENFSEHILLRGKDILKDDNNILDIKKLGVERNIVQKFLNEYDPSSSIIILKNELKKAFELSKSVVEYIKGLKKKETIYTKKIIEFLQKKHNIKIQIPYLEFLYEIVKNYFGVEVPKSSDIANFLGTL
ncbi:MAG: hypothetical protein EAX89_03485 [Candidatus Lokiarchaeota archaeon]|nr:hypothetical protein [Candidatus Lokiarchaeota archaeon]